jgi:hypothetical protein
MALLFYVGWKPPRAQCDAMIHKEIESSTPFPDRHNTNTNTETDTDDNNDIHQQRPRRQLNRDQFTRIVSSRIDNQNPDDKVQHLFNSITHGELYVPRRSPFSLK